MSKPTVTLNPSALQDLVALVHAQCPNPEAPTLADVEAGYLTVMRALTAQVIPEALGATKPASKAEAGKKGLRRSVADTPCGSAAGTRGPSPS